MGGTDIHSCVPPWRRTKVPQSSLACSTDGVSSDLDLDLDILMLNQYLHEKQQPIVCCQMIPNKRQVICIL